MTQDDELADCAEPVGMLLRQYRLAAAQTVNSLARDLCISPRYVLAIENGHVQELPEVPYALGFVRAYAEYFGLNELEIVERFRQQHFTAEDRETLRFPSPETNAEMPKGALLLSGAMTACILFAAWHFNAPPGLNPVKLVDPVPAHLTSLLSAQATPDPPAAADGSAPPRTVASDSDDVPETSGRIDTHRGVVKLGLGKT